MQTFLPYSSFIQTAKCLDYRRLGKQRVESYQILNAIYGRSKGNGWKSHPAVKMWLGSELWLFRYTMAIIHEWRRRGYKDTMFQRLLDEYGEFDGLGTKKPAWLGKKILHSSHKSALLFKDNKFYARYGWSEQPKLDYYWPTNK